MPDFWRHSGYHLLEPSASGHRITPDLLRAFYARPELAPIEESCEAERALFAALMDEPSRPVSDAEIAAMADADTQDNYRIVLKWRDHLLASDTIEAAYARLFINADGSARDFSALGIPPMFVDQLAHMVMRGLIEGCEDGLTARAAELFFREQKASVGDGSVVLADAEVVEQQAARSRAGSHFGGIGQLIAQAQVALKSVDLDVLSEENQQIYWARDERHDTALQLNYGRPGLKRLCELIERWVKLFSSLDVTVTPLTRFDTPKMRWFIGLSAPATALLNDLYNGKNLSLEQNHCLLALMKMEFKEDAPLLEAARGAPVLMALAMDGEDMVRMKPQNLIASLPLERRS